MPDFISARVSHLASELAAVTGEDLETALTRALQERLARVAPSATPGDIENIDAVFERLAQMPVLDSRTPDEIIGYGPNGLPSLMVIGAWAWGDFLRARQHNLTVQKNPGHGA